MQSSPVCVCKPAGKSNVMIRGKNQFKEAAGKQLNCLKEKLIFLSNFQGLQSSKGPACALPAWLQPFSLLLDPEPVIGLFEWPRCEH